MNLDQLAEYLRANGVPNAQVGTTGGNCHSIIIELPEGGEILVGDYEGPLPDGQTELDGIVALGYDAEHNPWTGMESGEDGLIWASEQHDVDEETGGWANWDAWADAAEVAEVLRDTIADLTQYSASMTLEEVYGDEHTRVGLEVSASTITMLSSLYDAEVSVDLTPAEARQLATLLNKFANVADAATA